MIGQINERKEGKNNSDTGNRTPSYRVKGGNVSRYTILDMNHSLLVHFRFYRVPTSKLQSLHMKAIRTTCNRCEGSLETHAFKSVSSEAALPMGRALFWKESRVIPGRKRWPEPLNSLASQDASLYI